MSRQNFLTNSIIVLLAMLPLEMTYGELGPQMNDFLCGCDYCETVDKGFPLAIASHMIRCHSWRKGMQKTMELMRQSQGKLDASTYQTQGIPTEQPKIEIEIREEEPKIIEENFSRENLTNVIDPYNDYQWRQNEDHGWTYATTHQSTTTEDGWLYREDLGWVWTYTESRNFLYSEQYGWFYSMRYNDRNLLYYYDRRYWLFAYDFWWKK